MPDNLNKRRPQDANKINVNEQYEIDYWTNELNVTEAQLRAAVKAVGPDVDEVKSYLAINR